MIFSHEFVGCSLGKCTICDQNSYCQAVFLRDSKLRMEVVPLCYTGCVVLPSSGQTRNIFSHSSRYKKRGEHVFGLQPLCMKQFLALYSCNISSACWSGDWRFRPWPKGVAAIEILKARQLTNCWIHLNCISNGMPLRPQNFPRSAQEYLKMQASSFAKKKQKLHNSPKEQKLNSLRLYGVTLRKQIEISVTKASCG